MVSLPGQALATQTLSIKGREEKVGDGSDVLICAFTPDHGEESLPLPGVAGYIKIKDDNHIRYMIFFNRINSFVIGVVYNQIITIKLSRLEVLLQNWPNKVQQGEQQIGVGKCQSDEQN